MAGDVQQSYLLGYNHGLGQGPELLLQAHLPQDALIPDITPDEAMAHGVTALRARGLRLLHPAEVAEQIDAAVRERRPYALVRLGDGELLTLAQDRVMSWPEIRRVGAFLPRAGVNVPDPAARDELLQAVISANAVGVPMSRLPHYQPLFMRIARAYGLDLPSMQLTTSTINGALFEHGCLMRILQGRQILVIGNAAAPLAAALQPLGIGIAGVIAPVRGVADAARVVQEAVSLDYDLAWVSAGIAAVPICTRLAAAKGKPAIDFGSLADRMAALPAGPELQAVPNR